MESVYGSMSFWSSVLESAYGDMSGSMVLVRSGRGGGCDPKPLGTTECKPSPLPTTEYSWWSSWRCVWVVRREEDEVGADVKGEGGSSYNGSSVYRLPTLWLVAKQREV